MNLKPVLSFKSKVVFLKDVNEGEPISYGRTFYTQKRTRIATIPVGYGDGYNRKLSNKGSVLIRGRRFPVIGAVCMDQMMVDLGKNSDVRVAMVDKRMRKLTEMQNDAFPPELTGNDDYTTLIVGWGSTFHSINEALSRLKRRDVAFLHFKQVYPLHPETEDYLKRAERIVVVEGNVNAQFASLIRLETGCEIGDTILKYDGSQFSVEELEYRLEATLG